MSEQVRVDEDERAGSAGPLRQPVLSFIQTR